MSSNQNLLYREWQYPRISSFLPLVLFIPAVWIVAAPFDTNLGLLIGFIFAALGATLKLTSSKSLSVTKDELILGDATIPKKVLGEITIVQPSEQFAARGSDLDARAFVFLKYGLPEMVKVKVNDPKDPTPYLLIATRNSVALVAALS